MGTGIIVCGLNGAGKSTLGRALAEKLHYHFIDNEDLYFPGKDPHNPYACLSFFPICRVDKCSKGYASAAGEGTFLSEIWQQDVTGRGSA